MKHYTITQPTHADIDSLIAMHAASWLEVYPSPENGVSDEWVAKRVNEMKSPSGRQKRLQSIDDALADPDVLYLVAKEQGRVVGFVVARKGANAELGALYIESAAYGSGLASELGAKAIEWIGEDSDAKLTVVSYNMRAQAFYQKLGFEVVEGSERAYKDTPMKVIDMLKIGVKHEV